MYEHLLVALDGSPAAEGVLEHAEALAAAFGSTITLLRATISTEMVVTESAVGDASIGEVAPTMDPQPVVDADHSAAVDYLNAVAARLRQRNLNVTVETPQGDADAMIVERASALDVRLILMTSHGRSGLGRMVFGSVSDAVLRHATCPVLLVRISHAEEAVRST